MNRLALGTVQFGLPYGVANSEGQVSRHEVDRIIRFARTVGIDTLDTAISYGESEQVLGDIGVEQFKVVTKIPPVPRDVSDVGDWVEMQIAGALHRLGISSLYAVLLHRSDDLAEANGKALARSLQRLKENGTVLKTGVSIYSPEELSRTFQIIDPDIVQAPLNVIDRRLVASGWLNELHSRSVEVHTRSAFLQGLLLMRRSEIPAKFERWSAIWDAWEKALCQMNISPISACLHFPMSLPGVSRVVVGVDGMSQLDALVKGSVTGQIDDVMDFMTLEDELLVNPARWGEL